MSEQSPEITIEFLEVFAYAWNRHDVDDLMSFMTDDCVFESSAGAEICGTRYEDREAGRVSMDFLRDPVRRQAGRSRWL
jgi:ketosteroid isomerase-like protein